MEIIPAQSDDHLLAARKLFVEYADAREHCNLHGLWKDK
jgi:desulfoferrodoxin (superoxide reductase-like protein)